PPDARPPSGSPDRLTRCHPSAGCELIRNPGNPTLLPGVTATLGKGPTGNAELAGAWFSQVPPSSLDHAGKCLVQPDTSSGGHSAPSPGTTLLGTLCAPSV